VYHYHFRGWGGGLGGGGAKHGVNALTTCSSGWHVEVGVGRGFVLVVRAAVQVRSSVGTASIHLDVYPQRREHFRVDMCAKQKFLFYFYFIYFIRS
jgi:hypothetical protein